MPPRKRTVRPTAHRDSVKTVKATARWDESKPRHHIFLFDGTCNDDTGANPSKYGWDQERQKWYQISDPAIAFAPIVTNVVRTWHALARDSDKQITHYFRGVANDDENDGPNLAVEGIFAHEASSIRNRAYVEFVRNFFVGDKISILGFSRGAAVARLFSKDLRERGLLDKVRAVTRMRTSRTTGKSWEEVRTLRTGRAKLLHSGSEIDIAFVGLWDTVATGMGADRSELDPSNPGHVVHCLALDENRKFFEPSLLKSPRAANAKEVWFPGSHSDVGGGYFHDALARVTLKFVWDNWNSALAKQKLPLLDWNDLLVRDYTDVTGLRPLRRAYASENPPKIGVDR